MEREKREGEIEKLNYRRSKIGKRGWVLCTVRQEGPKKEQRSLVTGRKEENMINDADGLVKIFLNKKITKEKMCSP